jgi:hypothetical protein
MATRRNRKSLTISQKWEIEYEGIRFEVSREEIEKAKRVMGSTTREIINRYILDKRFEEIIPVL